MKTAQVGVAAALAVVAVWSPALAARPARLAYEAPYGCPSEPEFVAAVTARGADFDAREATQGPQTLVVSIHRQGDGFAGAFQVRSAADATNKREVRGATCVEVADALAVVTAIALHSEADAGGIGSTGAGASAPDESYAASPASVSPAVAVDAPQPPRRTPGTPRVVAPGEDRLRGSTRAFPPRSESISVHAGTLRFDLQRSATVYAGASVGMIPSLVLPRYELSGLVASFVTTPEGEQRISSLVFKLRLGVLGPATYQSPDTKTDVSGISFGIDLCQSPHYDSKGLVLLFCGGYGGGVMMLKTKGLDGVAIQTKSMGFGEVLLSGELQYYLGAGVHVGLRLGGGFTVGQITAERADGSRIFASSAWSAQATLGLGFRF